MTNHSEDLNIELDVFCVGHASYDQIFTIDHHPAADEKTVASHMLACGGGPAANAAVCISRLGLKSGFAGYLGNDSYGDAHYAEFKTEGVNTQFIHRDKNPTPLSVILVKPDGSRSLVNYKGNTQPLAADEIAFNRLRPRVILMDGHEPELSKHLLDCFPDIPSILDAGSLHTGTHQLLNRVSDLVCSEKFACQYADNPRQALSVLATIHPKVVITLGEHGLIWRCGNEQGHLNAPQIESIDTTGAGDAFHAAYAAAIAQQLNWSDTLEYASLAGAWACTQLGARLSMPNMQNLQQVKLSSRFSHQVITNDLFSF